MGDDDFAQREVPAIAFDALSVGQLDRSRSDSATVAGLYGTRSELSAALPPRLVSLSVWLAKVAHQPAVLWWASHQPGLHPHARTLIERALQYEPERFDDAVRKGWRWLFASWDDRRKEADETSFRLRDRLKHEAWSESIVREIIDIRRPRLRVTPGYHHHPLKQNDPADGVVSVDVDYPSAHNPINVHEDYLRYAVEQMTSHLHLAVSLEGEILGREWLYLPSSGEGGTKDTETSHGLTGPIVTMRNLLIRLAAKDSKAAEEQVGRWPTDDEYVFARLRLWAAANSITSANTSAELFAKLSDEAFWGSRHRGELLDAIRRRWHELSSDDRSRLEHRLRTGSYPWNDEDTETQAERTAFERLNYLHWLSQNGVDFSFNLDAEIASLTAIAPQWHERFGKKAAEGSVSGVFSIGTDTDPGQLLRTPLSSILATAKESDRIDFEARVQREPFKGLSNKRPVLALAALTHAGRQGEAPRWAWSHFLQAERRAEDPLRMISAIAGRLDRLSDERLREIAYPVSDWMHRIEARLYGDASLLLPKLWRVVVRALRKEQTHIADRPDRSWADSALNAPVGRLFDLLHDDPSVHNREAAAGLPVDWQNRVEELFTLPGEQRCHAVVLASHNLAWFDRVASAWTEQNLLPLSASESAVGDAFWDGIIWSGGNGLNERLLRALLPDLKRLARHPRGRRRDDAIVPGLILSSWGQSIGCSTSDQLVTDVELRDLLVLADQTFAHEVIRYLENWSRQDGPWGDRTIYFFECVWPKQRKLRTSATSARLTHLLFESGSLLPRLAPLIVPRLVPLRGGWVNYISRDESDSDPAKLYPAFVLDVMWVILADDPQDWPHGALQTLDVLETAPETASDTRLAELRRRQGI